MFQQISLYKAFSLRVQPHITYVYKYAPVSDLINILSWLDSVLLPNIHRYTHIPLSYKQDENHANTLKKKDRFTKFNSHRPYKSKPISAWFVLGVRTLILTTFFCVYGNHCGNRYAGNRNQSMAKFSCIKKILLWTFSLYIYAHKVHNVVLLLVQWSVC